MWKWDCIWWGQAHVWNNSAGMCLWWRFRCLCRESYSWTLPGDREYLQLPAFSSSSWGGQKTLAPWDKHTPSLMDCAWDKVGLAAKGPWPAGSPHSSTFSHGPLKIPHCRVPKGEEGKWGRTHTQVQQLRLLHLGPCTACSGAAAWDTGERGNGTNPCMWHPVPAWAWGCAGPRMPHRPGTGMSSRIAACCWTAPPPEHLKAPQGL